MKFRHCYLSLIAGWLVILAFVSANAQEGVETPEQFAARYDIVSKTGNWAATAKLMHPEALIRFREIVAPFFDIKSNDLGPTIFGVKTKAAFDELSPEQVFERFMLFCSKVPEFAEAMKTAQMSILGHVKEGTEIAHVVYKVNVKVGAVTASKMDVMSLKRNGGKWSALLSGDYEGLAAALANPGKKPRPTVKPVQRKRGR